MSSLRTRLYLNPLARTAFRQMTQFYWVFKNLAQRFSRLDSGSATRASVRLLAQAQQGGFESMRNTANSFVSSSFVSETYGLTGEKLQLASDSITSTNWSGEFDPNPFFDTDFYMQNHSNEVIGSNLAPFMHYLYFGYSKGYLPNPLFGSSISRATYLQSGCEVGGSSQVFNELFVGNSLPWEEISPEYKREISPQIDLTEVAILIPVFNNWLWTERCLRALGRCNDVEINNVFVVDDCSTDKTLENLRDYFPRVQVIENSRNLGFLQSCNRAFGLLKTNYRYVLLLNNDTEPLPGFLAELIETHKLFDDSGVVGARLINADETLQEIGGIVWRDTLSWLLGRGARIGTSLLTSRRVDYASGACLLIDTKCVENNLFDTEFSPCYYEDADLAFRLRLNGYATRVAPFAVVVHHEGKSHGTDIAQGGKSFQKVNAEKFRRKWSETLSSHFDFSPLRVFEAAMRLEVKATSGTLLWIDSQLPDVTRDSGSVRAVQIAKALRSMGMLVIFVPENGDTHRVSPSQLLRLGVLVESNLSKACKTAKRLGMSPDYVMLSRVPIASKFLPKIRRLFPKARILFDTVDLHFLRIERQAKESGDKTLLALAAATKKIELETIGRCDVTLVVSDYERELLEELAPDARAVVVSNVHDHDGTESTAIKTRGMVFIGNFLHPPNAEGLLWFFSEVWPLLAHDTRSKGLTVIGQRPPGWLANLNDANVEVLGWVENADLIIASSTVSIAPLRSGAGVKGKVGQSIQLRTPVVGTSLAFEGMHLTHGLSCVEANDPHDFARSIEKVMFDKEFAEVLVNESVKVLQHFFSSKVAKDAIRLALEENRT